MKMVIELNAVDARLGEQLVILAREIEELDHFATESNVVATAVSKEIALKRFSFQEVLAKITKQLEAWDVKIVSTETTEDDERWF